MLKNKKHVFWQALLVTILIFSLGLVLGVYLEEIRTDKANVLFYKSEADLFDTLSLTNLLKLQELSCQDLNKIYIEFADKIYNEVKNIQQFDESAKITHSLKQIHKKYDLLRTILWININENKEKCPSIKTIIYLYEYDAKNINKKATQNVFSKILNEVKEKKGNEFILIPIAVDTEIYSLKLMLETLNIKETPVIIINHKYYLNEIVSSEEIE
ncbi:MAG: hypothetical protein QXH60_03310, partial [Candidatus Pacearchaeota archaeon]